MGMRKNLLFIVSGVFFVSGGLYARGPALSKITHVQNNSSSPVMFSLIGVPTRKDAMKRIEIIQPGVKSKLTNLVIPKGKNPDRAIWIGTMQGVFKIYDFEGAVQMSPYSLQNPVTGITMNLGKTGKVFSITIGDKGVIAIE